MVGSEFSLSIHFLRPRKELGVVKVVCIVHIFARSIGYYICTYITEMFLLHRHYKSSLHPHILFSEADKSVKQLSMTEGFGEGNSTYLAGRLACPNMLHLKFDDTESPHLHRLLQPK